VEGGAAWLLASLGPTKRIPRSRERREVLYSLAPAGEKGPSVPRIISIDQPKNVDALKTGSEGKPIGFADCTRVLSRRQLIHRSKEFLR